MISSPGVGPPCRNGPPGPLQTQLARVLAVLHSSSFLRSLPCRLFTFFASRREMSPKASHIHSYDAKFHGTIRRWRSSCSGCLRPRSGDATLEYCLIHCLLVPTTGSTALLIQP